MTATLTPNEIMIKLAEKDATIKCEKGLGQEALLFAKGNGKGTGKGRKSSKGNESGEDQGTRKGHPTCFYCHEKGQKVWNCPSVKRSDPPVTNESTETAAKAKDDTITAARDSVEMRTTIENYWVAERGGKTAPSKESWYLDCASTSQVCGDRRKFARYMGFTKQDEWEIRDFARRVAGQAVGQGDVQLKFRLPGNREHEVVVRDVLHVAGAHNSLSQSRLMDGGLQIVPVNSFGIKIYDAPEMGTGRRGEGSIVAVAPQVRDLFQFDVDVARKGRRSRDVCRDKR